MALISLASFGQKEENDDFQTLFDFEDVYVSGFGGPVINICPVKDHYAPFMGGGGGAILNRKFFFGGFGAGMTQSINLDDHQYDKLDFSYGGLWLGYIFMGEKAIHPTFHVQMGWGGISLQERSGDIFDEDKNDPVYVINPTLELEMNLTQFFRLGVGVNYRYTTGVDTEDIHGLTNKDFSSPGGFVSFKFGWF